MRKLLVSFATGMALILPTVSAAVGLGGIKVYTKLNQKLNAEIPILAVNNANRKTLSVTMGSNQDFARRGLEKSDSVRKVKLNIMHKGNRSYIKVTSEQLINVPYLNFIVNLNSDEGLVTREYAVFLDPVGGVKGTPSTKSIPKQPAIRSNSYRNSAGVSVIAKKKTSRKVAISNQRGTKYGPVRRGETLWSIAKHVRPSEKVSVRSMMNAIIRANPRVFPNRRANEMPSGVMLNIPTLKGYSAYKGGYAPMPSQASVIPTTNNSKLNKSTNSAKKSGAVSVKKSEAAVRPLKSVESKNTASLKETSKTEDPSALEEVKNTLSETSKNASDDVANAIVNTNEGISDTAQVKTDSLGNSVDAIENKLETASDSIKSSSELAQEKSNDVSNAIKNTGQSAVDTTKESVNNVVGNTTEPVVEKPVVKQPTVTKPKNKPPIIKAPIVKETLIPGVPNISTYIGGGVILLGLLGGLGYLLSRRKKTVDIGKGVVLTDESDIDNLTNERAEEVLLDDDDEVLVVDSAPEAEVDDDLLLDLDDDLVGDDNIVTSSDIGTDELDEFDLDDLNLDSDDLNDVASNNVSDNNLIDDGLDFDLDESDNLFSTEKASDDSLIIDDEDFVFDLDEVSEDEKNVNLDSGDENDFDFTTADDLDGLEDLSLDIDDAEISLDDEKLGEEFSLDLANESTDKSDDDLNFDTSDDLDIDFSEDFELDEHKASDVSDNDELDFTQVSDNSLSFDDNELDFDLSADELDDKLDSVLSNSEIDDDLTLDEIDTESELEQLLEDADEPIDLRPTDNDVISPDSDNMISFDETSDEFTSTELDDESHLSEVELNVSKAQMKLDLANSFISIGETSRASSLLQEVIDIGDEGQIAEAKNLLDNIS